jgi:hypothetical protein
MGRLSHLEVPAGGDPAAIGAKLSEIRAKHGDEEHPGNQA